MHTFATRPSHLSRKLAGLVLALTLISLAAPDAAAQRGRGFGGYGRGYGGYYGRGIGPGFYGRGIGPGYYGRGFGPGFYGRGYGGFYRPGFYGGYYGYPYVAPPVYGGLGYGYGYGVGGFGIGGAYPY